MINYIPNKKKKTKKTKDLKKIRKKLILRTNNFRIQPKRNYILMKNLIIF